MAQLSSPTHARKPHIVDPSPTGGLRKLRGLLLERTQDTGAGCAALAAALDRGAWPALEWLFLKGIPASAAARATVRRAGLRVVDNDDGGLTGTALLAQVVTMA